MSDPHLYASLFVVDEKPFCVWDVDLPERNADLIDHLDFEYFAYTAAVLESEMTGDNSRRAAVLIRSAYAHALESFFAILFSALQAPDCVPGWLAKYGLDDLRSLAGKARGRDVKTKFRVPDRGWSGIAETVFMMQYDADDRAREAIRKGLGGMWGRFAHVFSMRRTRSNTTASNMAFELRRAASHSEWGRKCNSVFHLHRTECTPLAGAGSDAPYSSRKGSEIGRITFG